MNRRSQGEGEVGPTSASYLVEVKAGTSFVDFTGGSEDTAFADEQAAVEFAAALAKRTGCAARVWRRHEREHGHDLDLIREVRPSGGLQPPVA